MIPAKLEPGDEVRVVSPAVSLGLIPVDQRTMAAERFRELGSSVSFSRNAEVMDRFDSSPVEARVSYLHEAFADPGVKAIIATLGGYTTFGMKRGIEYTKEYFQRCLMSDAPFEVLPADHWSDDPWYEDQENRDFVSKFVERKQ